MNLYRMMIVDDEPYVVEGIRDSIPWSKYGVRVCAEAYDGLSALEKARQTRPDIIIADIRMPELNGMAFIEQARAFLPEAKFILISAFAEFEWAQKALSLGVLQYLVKPVRMTEIIDAVKRAASALDAQEQARQAARRQDASGMEGMEAAKAYIRAHWQENVTLSEVAAHVSFSPSYLSRRFKKETGHLFVDYVKQVKFDHAKRLLETTGMKVYEISALLGYQSVQYFTTMFKQMAGQSPFEYRQKCRDAKQGKG